MSLTVPPKKRPRPRSEILADELRKQILAENYRPGDRLPPERQLAQRLGVGRSTVREAFKKLEQLRLVEIRHGGGAMVRRIEDASLDIVPMLLRSEGKVSLSMVEQLFEARRVLIIACTRLAVKRAGPEELAAVRRVLWRLDDGGVSDLEYFRDLDELFRTQPWWRRLLCRPWHEAARGLYCGQTADSYRNIFDSLLEGYDLIENRLRRTMVQRSIVRMKCLGEQADPHRMTVLEVVGDPTRRPGTVIEEVRPGYCWDGRVLRFAEVKAVGEQ